MAQIILLKGTQKRHIDRLSDAELKRFRGSTVDEYGVQILNIMHNGEVGISFYFLEAPSKKGVEKHHGKYGVKCNWITEVQTVA